MGDDGFPQAAAIKITAPLGGKGLERARELGLANDASQRHTSRAAGVIPRPVVIERRPAAQQRDLLVELRHAKFGERKAVPRQRDRRLQGLAQGLPAVGAHQLCPAG